MRGRRPAKKKREDWLRSCTLNLGYKKWARPVVMEDGRCLGTAPYRISVFMVFMCMDWVPLRLVWSAWSVATSQTD